VSVRDLLRPVRRATPAQAAIIALALSSMATALGLLIDRQGDVIAVSSYFLAVVLASAAGGIRAGVIAAVLSSLGFTFFFTAPAYALRVARVQDAVAAGVFLVVGSVVGLLVARMTDERERASERERDARLLGYLATKLLSGEPLDRVLDDFASALIEPFGLLRCEVSAKMDEGEAETRMIGREGSGGPSQMLEISIGNVSFGTLTAVRPVGGRTFTSDEGELLEAAAKQAAFALERARLDAQVRGAQLESETSRLRAALFSSVTHDLRTPLASIKAGVSSLLSDEASYDPAQQRELLTTVLEETDRMNRLVGNLMDLSRIRAGALVLAREAAAIDEIVEAVVARMRPRLQRVSVRLNIRPELPDVFVDPVQIDQVLTNLLENAAAHSPAGGEVQVAASSFRDSVQVRVADQGPGIPEAERERVFEAFYRGDAAPERPGSGLGLAIAQAIVVAHGGRIWIEGAPGGGTVVVFELPVKVEPA
jgi:two-component system, OmpR family, sensor histidine kinase KdpD